MEIKKTNTGGERESFHQGQENALSGHVDLFHLWVLKSEEAVLGSLLVRDPGRLLPPYAQPSEEWSFLSCVGVSCAPRPGHMQVS